MSDGTDEKQVFIPSDWKLDPSSNGNALCSRASPQRNMGRPDLPVRVRICQILLHIFPREVSVLSHRCSGKRASLSWPCICCLEFQLQTYIFRGVNDGCPPLQSTFPVRRELALASLPEASTVDLRRRHFCLVTLLRPVVFFPRLQHTGVPIMRPTGSNRSKHVMIWHFWGP